MAISFSLGTIAVLVVTAYILGVSVLAWKLAPSLQEMILGEAGLVSEDDSASEATKGQYNSSEPAQSSNEAEKNLTEDITVLKLSNKALHKTIENLQSSEAFTSRDQKIVRLRKENTRLATELATEKRAVARAKALQASSDEAATRLAGVEGRAQTAETTILMLKTQLDRANKLVKSLEDIRKVLRGERDALEGQNKMMSSELTVARDEINRLEVEDERVRARVQELEIRHEQAEWSKLKPVEMPHLRPSSRPKLTLETKHATCESEEEEL